MPTNWKSRWKSIGRGGQIFCLLLLLYLPLAFLIPSSGGVLLLQLILIILGAWLALRLTRRGMRKAIWRLRNRLLVTYLFIAVVPVLLVAVLASLGAYFLISQLAVYLAVSDLERRSAALEDIAQTIAETDPRMRPDVMQHVINTHHRRFPDLAIVARSPAGVQKWPTSENLTSPPEGWAQSSGVVARENRYYLWSHVIRGDQRVTVLAPLSRAYLSNMVPGLGDVSLVDITDPRADAPTGKPKRLRPSRERPMPLPPAYGRFDPDVQWFSTLSVWRWEVPGTHQLMLLYVHTRPSAVLNTIFNAKVDQIGEVLPVILLGVAILFLIVECIALVIGVSLTRTITSAVHNLHEGTQRVMRGDFSHLIEVHGTDQLGELGSSFNTMTANLEQLLAVAKEKERLQAELEIAKQVQEQLYPKVAPELKTMRLQGICKPARMVSGDYYDYLALPDKGLALAIGDVAGKGISAALLMASIQSAMRMELRTPRSGALLNGKPDPRFATSTLVGALNKQLYATTSPEKYATFFFALYDEDTNELRYTNAGHLPPLLVRDGAVTALEVSGTVVGAFPHAPYDENRVQLETGDLLVCYTDGITEPENEYGEMFGEERLIELLVHNSGSDEPKLIAMILDAVEHWTSAAEQPDDMTLLLARKL